MPLLCVGNKKKHSDTRRQEEQPVSSQSVSQEDEHSGSVGPSSCVHRSETSSHVCFPLIAPECLNNPLLPYVRSLHGDASFVFPERLTKVLKALVLNWQLLTRHLRFGLGFYPALFSTVRISQKFNHPEMSAETSMLYKALLIQPTLVYDCHVTPKLN